MNMKLELILGKTREEVKEEVEKAIYLKSIALRYNLRLSFNLKDMKYELEVPEEIGVAILGKYSDGNFKIELKDGKWLIDMPLTYYQKIQSQVLFPCKLIRKYLNGSERAIVEIDGKVNVIKLLSYIRSGREPYCYGDLNYLEEQMHLIKELRRIFS